MNPLSDIHARGLSMPGIRRVFLDCPFSWLAAGWRDVKANPLPSLAYGLLFALGGDMIILAALDRPHLVSVAISGFFLLAPLLAAGLYELSRSTARGEKLLFIDSLRCFTHNGRALALFGLILALAVLLWERISAISFSLVALQSPASAGAFLSELLSGEHLVFATLWILLGAMLALLVFAVSVVAVPILLDRQADLASAMLTSLRAFGQNTGPLLLWAGLIVTLTLLGFATLLFGLVIIMPILGHASWHAYRDLVE